MMTWIESHRALAGHPKTKRLAKRLGISTPAAIGHLHLVWWWASAYVEQGDLSPFEIDEIEAEAMWEGERGELMAALESTGFIDREPTGLVIHDWYSYWGKYDDRKRANADRTRAYRERLKTATSEPRDAHVIDTQRARDGATEQDNTEQEIDKPAGKIKSLDSARARELSESFDVFWAAYPRKAGKKDAESAWGKLKPSAELRAKILAALERHKLTRDWLKDGGAFVPYPATWLNGKRWEDELGDRPANPNRVFGGDGRLAL